MAAGHPGVPEDSDTPNAGGRPAAGQDDTKAVPYDFRRRDRIAKDQLRAIHLLHDGFAKKLASSLSLYLRAYVGTNLRSVEQLSFAEFTEGLPCPSCIVLLGMRPYDGKAVLEINGALAFPVLEMLLGGSGRTPVDPNRRITDIEQVVLDGVYRVILQDLRNAWGGIAPIDFTIEARETDPQLLQVMAPHEAIVCISIEVRMGENGGIINLGLPSLVIKMLRQKFDHQWSPRRTEPGAEEQAAILRLIKPALLEAEASFDGPTISGSDLTRLVPGDLVIFDSRVDRPMSLLINGRPKYHGHVGTIGRKRVFVVDEIDRDK